jgi:hypothetical protein
MSKVYYTYGSDIKNLTPKTVDDDDQVPSVKYVKDALKALTDELNDKIDGFSGSINYPLASLDVLGKNSQNENDPDSESRKVRAEDIITDAKHKFITQAQLDSFKDKPTMQELNMVMSTISDEIEQRVDAAYVNIMNTPNALQKLKDLAILLRDNSDIIGISELAASKVDKKDFEVHKDSVLHMSSNDRKALNALIKALDIGFADWNATEDDQNFIKHKPTSLPANGGNADTLAGRSADAYLTSRVEDYVIGYDPDKSDITVDDDTKDITPIFRGNSYKGLMAIQSGIYYLSDDCTITSIAYNTPGSCTISGNNTATVINGQKHIIVLDKGVILKNLMITDCAVIVKSNVEIEHVLFKNCNVEFASSSKSVMKYCTFEGSSFKYSGICQNNMVLFNRGDKSINFKYIGGNCIVDGNQTY